MWCIRHRLCQSGPIFIFCSLVLTAGFLLQFHALYTIYQRNSRFREYKSTMNELSETLGSVARVANVTDILMHRLRERLKLAQEQHLKYGDSGGGRDVDSS